MKPFQFARIFLGSLLVLTLALPTLSPADAKNNPITCVFSNIAETHTLDPAIAFSSDGILFVRNVYEGLTEYEPGTAKVRPLLATGWEVSGDGLKYTFTLKAGVKFHDGSDFNAESVCLSIERIKSINQGPASLIKNIEKCTPLSPNQVEITLAAPDFYFLGRIAKAPIMSPRMIAEYKTESDPWARDWYRSNASGTGPYRFTRWFRNSRIELEKYDGYWRPFAEGTPDRVILRVDPDITTAIQLMVQGKIHMIGAVGPDDSIMAADLPDVKLIRQPMFEVKTLHLNTLKKPLDDPRVRRAIEYAFDYDAYTEFFQGLAVVPIGPLPSNMPGADTNLPQYEQNLEKARELLAQAGYPGGKFKLQYLGLKGLSYEEFAGTLLQDGLKKIGIDLEQILVPWPQMPEIMSQGKEGAHISFLNMSSFVNDPSYILNTAYHSDNHANKGGYNWSFYSNPEVDAGIDRVKTIADEKERNAVLHKLQRQIRDDVPVINIVQPELAQPVRVEWDCLYEIIDYNYVVRFFYARKIK